MPTIEQLRELAVKATGSVQVSYEEEERRWFWVDLAETPRQWRGPFKTERAAWLNALRANGVAVPVQSLRPASAADVENAKVARAMLTEAHKLLRRAGALKAAARVASTFKSVEGAINHAERRARAGGDR
jgi:hypothetical protein